MSETNPEHKNLSKLGEGGTHPNRNLETFPNRNPERDYVVELKTDEFNNFSINSKKKIIDLLNPLITSYLKKESIQILLQKDKIIFGDDKLDITEEILKLFNDKHKKIKFE